MQTTSPQTVPAYAKVGYQTATIDRLNIFYREAGDPKRPAIVLLHGFPTSSHMYRELLPALGLEYHVIAPDYPGFGYSSVPEADSFDYTFDRLARVMEAFLQKIGTTRFALYMQDYGSPVGLRIASRHPDWVRALIIQNANAYLEGVGPAFEAFKPFWKERNT